MAALGLLGLLHPRVASAQEPQNVEDARASEPPRPTEGRSASTAYDPFQLKITGGALYRRIFTLPFYGADVGLSIGGQPSEHGAFYGTLHVFRGRTEYGLTTTMVRAGGAAEGVFDRFRPGLGVELLYLGFERVGRGSNIDTPALGVYGTLSLDVVKIDGSAIFLGARFDVDATWQADFAWGPGAYLGFRYGSR
jgi:hypothetical protein